MAEISSNAENFRFLELDYNDVSTEFDGKSASRASIECPNYVYLSKSMKRGDIFSLKVDTVIEGALGTSFVFGLAICSPEDIENNEAHVTQSCRFVFCDGQSAKLKMPKAKVRDTMTFERRHDGYVYFAINDGKVTMLRFANGRHVLFKEFAELTPFVRLNGHVWKITFVDNPTRLKMDTTTLSEQQLISLINPRKATAMSTNYLPTTDWQTSSNVVVIDSTQIILMDGELGRLLNQLSFKPLQKLTFKVRGINASRLGTLSFALVDHSNSHFREESLDDEVPASVLEKMAVNIINEPEEGLVFALFRKANGQVTVRCRQQVRTLFTVDPTKDLWPLVTFSGSVTAIETIPSNTPIPRVLSASGGTVQSRKPTSGQTSQPSSAMDSSKRCIICMEEPIDCAIVSCGHMKTCMACAQKIQNEGDARCPICRSYILSLLKVYLD